MFTRFKREKETLFLDPNATEKVFYDKSKKLSLILSPSLYWVKKLKLPIKSVRELKKLLPSIFEDTLPEGHYSFTAYKSGDEFFAFAYEDKKIFDLLNKKGINYAHIASVHFAQSEFFNSERAFCVNAKECMYVKDELLVLAPSAWISEKQELNLEQIKLSKNSVKLQQFGHIVDDSSLYKIGIILAVLALIFVAEIFIVSSKKSEIVALREDLFTKYNLQSTMLQNRSSLQTYSGVYKRQSKFREYISYFLAMKLNAEQKIELIDYKNNLLSVSISGASKAKSQNILKELDAKKISYKTSYKDENLKVEIEI